MGFNSGFKGLKWKNERLANSLTAKFEAAHHKIREDFEAKRSSEIITVSKNRQCT